MPDPRTVLNCRAEVKVLLPDSLLGRATFADFYGFCISDPGPLVLFVGGAVPEDDYEAGRRRYPEPVLLEFESARRAAARSARLLIVSPPPQLAGAAPFALSPFCRHLADELLPRVVGPSTPIACVGVGLGAFLAAGFAARTPTVVALATLGGAKLPQALADPQPAPTLAVRCFANHEDPLRRYSDELYSLLWARGLDCGLSVRPGTRAFFDYLANGAVEEAFGFCLERLASAPQRPAMSAMSAMSAMDRSA